MNKEKSAEFLQWASQERTRLAFENNVPILLMATLTALSIIGVTVGYHRLNLSIPWFLLLVMVYLARYRLYLRFVESGAVGEQAANWRNKFLAGAAAAGVMWGIGLFIVFPENSIALQMIIMLTAFGIMGVTLVGYSSDVTAALLFNTPVAAILAIRLLTLDADHGLTLLLGLAILYSISVLLSRNLERFAMESLWVKYQNIGLAERLDSAQARLKAL
ncbi:MAG: hypothetical protein OEV92_11885, partial [Nitrospinota bacterium]|nr:hypothetical protein [Nitrospinota bacterium]